MTQERVFVFAGDRITDDPATLMGHGTRLIPPHTLVATVSGHISRVNQLVTVQANNRRYTAQVGDLCIGRVVAVSDDRFTIDIGASTAASLLLSQVSLPNDVIRRRNQSDAVTIRRFFRENDLLTCEVQKIRHSDGNITVHTRAGRYGKLSRGGALVTVRAGLIRRCRQHVQSVSDGLAIILGVNGRIWITEARTLSEAAAESASPSHSADAALVKALDTAVSAATRECIARTYNAIVALADAHLEIYNVSIKRVYARSKTLGFTAKQLVQADIARIVTQTQDETDMTDADEDDSDGVVG